jgi:hypothetical protein
MESNNLVIKHKHGKKIYLIERFVAGVYERELYHVCGYTWALELMCVRKNIIFKSVIFQNLVQNLCNVGLIMHL